MTRPSDGPRSPANCALVVLTPPDMCQRHASHSHRRRVVVLLSAAVTLVAVDLSLRRFAQPLSLYDNNTYEKKAAALARAGRADVILLGSSRVRYGLVPEEFRAITGRPTFNLGVSKSRAVEWRLFARTTLADRAPELVVLGVNAGEFRARRPSPDAARLFFRFDDLWRYTRAYGWESAMVGAYVRGQFGGLWSAFDQRFPLRMAIHDRVIPRCLSTSELAADLRAAAERGMPSDGDDHPWPRSSPARTFADILRSVSSGDRLPPPPLFDSRDPCFAEFAGLLDWFGARGVPVVVVYLPNSPSVVDYWRRVEPPMRAHLADICRKHATPLLSIDPAALSCDDRDYVDESHAGLPLARRISRLVIEQIQARGLLKRPTSLTVAALKYSEKRGRGACPP